MNYKNEEYFTNRCPTSQKEENAFPYETDELPFRTFDNTQKYAKKDLDKGEKVVSCFICGLIQNITMKNG